MRDTPAQLPGLSPFTALSSMKISSPATSPAVPTMSPIPLPEPMFHRLEVEVIRCPGKLAYSVPYECLLVTSGPTLTPHQ